MAARRGLGGGKDCLLGSLRREGVREGGCMCWFSMVLLADPAGCDTHGCWSWIPTVLGVFFVISSAL